MCFAWIHYCSCIYWFPTKYNSGLTELRTCCTILFSGLDGLNVLQHSATDSLAFEVEQKRKLILQKHVMMFSVVLENTQYKSLADSEQRCLSFGHMIDYPKTCAQRRETLDLVSMCLCANSPVLTLIYTFNKAGFFI